MSKLTFKVLGSGYEVRVGTGRDVIGMIDRDVDGLFYWFPNKSCDGSWQSWVLRQLAEKIEALNIPVHHEQDEFFQRNP